jgi:hypothetical protein
MTTPVSNPVFKVTNLTENIANSTFDLVLENGPTAANFNPMMGGGQPNSLTLRADVGVLAFGLTVGKTYTVAFTEVAAVAPTPAP